MKFLPDYTRQIGGGLPTRYGRRRLWNSTSVAQGNRTRDMLPQCHQRMLTKQVTWISEESGIPSEIRSPNTA
jgi:hypothetical protein